MTDISKCNYDLCPSSNKCWRFLSPANPHWQAYAAFNPDGKEKCEYFIDATDYLKYKKNEILH
jgi:hypothetical protein